MSKKKDKTSKPEEINEAQQETVEKEVVNDELENIKEELAKEKDRFLRLFAEFENYKKRTTKERVEMFKTASQEVMTSMLPVLDDFDRAVAEIEKAEDDTVFKGILLINNKLRETLKNKGLSVMEVNKGDDFNADNHEAITQISAPSDDLKGKIVDVLEKGYLLGEKVLRYPKVVIGQ